MELVAGMADGEAPADGGLVVVALLLAGVDIGTQGIDSRQALRQAVAGYHRQLDLVYVQLVAMDRSDVKAQLLGDLPG